MAKSEKDIFEKVKVIVADKLSKEKKDINLDSNFIEDLGADSLDIVELVMAFEEEFNLEVPDKEAEKLKTVGDAVNYLKKNLK